MAGQVFTVVHEITEAIFRLIREEPALVLLYGDLGVGKTHLVRQVLARFGADRLVRSPSFVLLNLYDVDSGIRVGHLDLYRLLNTSDTSERIVEELGLTDYIGVIPLFIEWPQPIVDFLYYFKDAVPIYKVTITLDDQGIRRYELSRA